MVSSVGCDNGVVDMYDSIYDGTVMFNFVRMQKQTGGSDCGLFAIAISTAICNGLDPTTMTSAMRSHLVNCLKNETMTLFPKL